MGKSRTAGKRPVIAIRVHNDLYEQIVKSAAAHRLSISEEAESRIRKSFSLEQELNEFWYLPGEL